MDTTAADLLKKHAQAMGLSIRFLGKLAGISAGHINRVANGHEPVPLRLAHDFADILHLFGPEREEWLREVRLAHCPPEIVSEYREMAARLRNEQKV